MRDKKKCRLHGKVKKCNVKGCRKQAQLFEGEWEWCQRHYKHRHASVKRRGQLSHSWQRPTCQAFSGAERCTRKTQQDDQGLGVMCRRHYRLASSCLPQSLVIISIDPKRLKRCHVELAKYKTNVFANTTNAELVVSKSGRAMQSDGTLPAAMRAWCEDWRLEDCPLTLGEIGCSLAHLEALKHACDADLTVAVCEDDDVVNVEGVKDHLKTVLIANTVPGWGILRTGQHAATSELGREGASTMQLTNKVKLSWGTTRWGLYAYIATPSGARAALEALRANPQLYNTPADVWMSSPQVAEAAGVKFLDPALVSYRTDVISTTAAN